MREPFEPKELLMGKTSLILAVLLAGCFGKAVRKIENTEVTVSITVKGDDARLVTLHEELTRRFGVQAHLKVVRTGVTILKIIGIYVAVMDALQWLVRQSLELLGNDENSRLLLEAAVALIKSGG